MKERSAERAEGHGVSPAGIDVLSPSLDQLAERRVHPRVELRDAEHERDAPSGSEDVLGEGEIFRHLVAHRVMATRGDVRFARHEQALPVRDLLRDEARPTHGLCAAIAREQDGEELRLDDPLPERTQLLRAGDAEQIGAARLDGAHDAGHEIRRLPGVGVEKADDGAAARRRARAACPLLAEPVARERRRGDDAQSRIVRREPGRNHACVVSRVIVDADHLEPRIVGGERGGEAAGDVARFVAGGDHEGDEWGVDTLAASRCRGAGVERLVVERSGMTCAKRGDERIEDPRRGAQGGSPMCHSSTSTRGAPGALTTRRSVEARIGVDA